MEASMASVRQIAANRRNARSSTGPRTEAGKERSRANAIRHGLTAETVLVHLEDRAEYSAFEAAIEVDYAPNSTVERQLVARLASLLWRLRRSTLIETGLFEMHRAGKTKPEALSVFYRMLDRNDPKGIANSGAAGKMRSSRPRKIATARTFLNLTKRNDAALERVNRYERMLWRQVAQTILLLDAAHARLRSRMLTQYRA
jgi:hypothetical protein